MKKIFITTIAAFTAMQYAQAQATVNPELKGLINQSFAYFPKIKEAENAVETAKQRLEITKNNRPVVDANASL